MQTFYLLTVQKTPVTRISSHQISMGCAFFLTQCDLRELGVPNGFYTTNNLFAVLGLQKV